MGETENIEDLELITETRDEKTRSFDKYVKNIELDSYESNVSLLKRLATYLYHFMSIVIIFVILDFLVRDDLVKIIIYEKFGSVFVDFYNIILTIAIVIVPFGLFVLIDFFILPYKTGYTLSSYLFNYKIEAIKGKLRTWHLFKRMICILFLNITYLNILSIFFIIFRKDKRAIHDILSSTTTKKVTNKIRLRNYFIIVLIPFLGIQIYAKIITHTIYNKFISPTEVELQYEIDNSRNYQNSSKINYHSIYFDNIKLFSSEFDSSITIELEQIKDSLYRKKLNNIIIIHSKIKNEETISFPYAYDWLDTISKITPLSVSLINLIDSNKVDLPFFNPVKSIKNLLGVLNACLELPGYLDNGDINAIVKNQVDDKMFFEVIAIDTLIKESRLSLLKLSPTSIDFYHIRYSYEQDYYLYLKAD